MGLKYSDNEILVFHGIFRGLRVRNLKDQSQTIPGLELMEKTLRTWAEFPKLKFSSRRARALAEAKLFRDCGRLAVNPDDERVFELLYYSGKPLIEHYWRRGEMSAILEQSE